MEEMRRQFDKWWDEKLSGAFNSCPKEHNDSAYHAAWLAYQEAWKQSRAALVVELPVKEVIQDEELLIPDECDWPDGYNSGVEACAKVIRALGITVKGEGNER